MEHPQAPSDTQAPPPLPPLVLSPGFLFLAAEIRQEIYRALFIHPQPIFLRSTRSGSLETYAPYDEAQTDINTAVLALCRQVNLEASQILYGPQNNFILKWSSLCVNPPLQKPFSDLLTTLTIDCTTINQRLSRARGTLVKRAPGIDCTWKYIPRILNLTETMPGLSELFFDFDNAAMLMAAALDTSNGIPCCTSSSSSSAFDTPELRLCVFILQQQQPPPPNTTDTDRLAALDSLFRRQGSQLIDLLAHRGRYHPYSSRDRNMLTKSHAPNLQSIVLTGPTLCVLLAKLDEHRCLRGECGWVLVSDTFSPDWQDAEFTGQRLEFLWGHRGPPAPPPTNHHHQQTTTTNPSQT